MKTVRVSADVWNVVEETGKFGETPDDVLRRLLGLPAKTNMAVDAEAKPDKISARVRDRVLRVALEDGVPREWVLPDKEQTAEIAQTREEALEMLREAGASVRQQAAVKRALTSAGYRMDS